MSRAWIDPASFRGMPLFAGLDPAALDAVVAAAQVGRMVKGTHLCRQGDPAAAGHALIDGRVKIVQTGAEGAPVVLRHIGPGEVFAMAAVLSGNPYPADAVAVTDGVVAHWPAGTLSILMETHPRLALNALAIIGRRLGEAQNRLRELSQERVERRLARALLRLAGHAGRRVDGGVAIDFPLSRQDLAEMTGTTLHTVSRTLSAWEAQGLVACARQRVVIRKGRDLAGLVG